MCIVELYYLNDLYGDEYPDGDDAYVMVVRNGMKVFLNPYSKNDTDLLSEMKSFKWGRKYYDIRRKKVFHLEKL